MNLRSALLVTGLFTAAVASAVTPVGTWTGKFQFKLPAMPANTPPAQKAMVEKSIAQMKNGKIILTMKADKTYSMKAVGLPSFGKQDNAGTWSQAGNVVSVKENKPGAKAQPFDLSKDGKTMVFKFPGGQGSLTFTR